MEMILGKFEIHSKIAASSMSTIYKGWDTVIQRPVAIKAVPLAPGSGTMGADASGRDAAGREAAGREAAGGEAAGGEAAQSLARFRREAQAAGRLQHPNIVGIFDYGETSEFAYIVMEFVDGETLKAALEGGKRFQTGAIMSLMNDILSALQYTHSRGVIHRDIKPANIMLDRSGRAKIADFGIAHLRDSELTQIGTIMGTPAYMSPEQFRGDPTSASTDIYSTGVILYQLLTNTRPFDGGLATIMHKALNTEPPKPSQVSSSTPRLVDDVVARAMAKRSDQRFGSAEEFQQALAKSLVVRPARGSEVVRPARGSEVVRPARGSEVMRPARESEVVRPAPKQDLGAMTFGSARRTARFGGGSLVLGAGLAVLLAGGGGYLAFRNLFAPARDAATQQALMVPPPPPALAASAKPLHSAEAAAPAPAQAPAADTPKPAPATAPLAIPVVTPKTDMPVQTTPDLPAAAPPVVIPASLAPLPEQAVRPLPGIASPIPDAVGSAAAAPVAPAHPASTSLVVPPRPPAVVARPGPLRREARTPAARRPASDDVADPDALAETKPQPSRGRNLTAQALSGDPLAASLSADPVPRPAPEKPAAPTGYGTFGMVNGQRTFIPNDGAQNH